MNTNNTAWPFTRWLEDDGGTFSPAQKPGRSHPRRHFYPFIFHFLYTRITVFIRTYTRRFGRVSFAHEVELERLPTNKTKKETYVWMTRRRRISLTDSVINTFGHDSPANYRNSYFFLFFYYVPVDPTHVVLCLNFNNIHLFRNADPVVSLPYFDDPNALVCTRNHQIVTNGMQARFNVCSSFPTIIRTRCRTYAFYSTDDWPVLFPSCERAKRSCDCEIPFQFHFAPRAPCSAMKIT